MFVIRSSVGIDFRDDGFTIVHLQRRLQGCRVRHSLFYTYPPGIKAEEIDDAAAGEIQSFFRRARISADHVRVGVPRREAMVKLITLPEAAKENLDQVIRYEIERYLPFRADEICFDHHLMGPGRRPKTISVMLAAVKKDKVEKYLEILRKAGIRPSAMEISSTALANAYGLDKANRLETLILVEMGKAGLEVDVIADRNLIFSRFRQYPDHDIPGAVSEELDRALTHVGDAPQGRPKSKVSAFFSGAGVSEDLVRDINDREGLSCEPASPKVGFPESKDGMEKPFQLAAAVGLALGGVRRAPIRIDLLSGSAHVRPSRIGKGLTTLLIVLLVTAGLLWQGGRIFRQRMELKRLSAEIERLKPSVESVLLLRRKAENIKFQVEELTNEINQAPGSLRLLRELSRIIPATVWLSNFNYEGKKLVISGYAQSASGLISILEASPLLEKVKFTAPINVDPRMDRERFQIEAEMKP